MSSNGVVLRLSQLTNETAYVNAVFETKIDELAGIPQGGDFILGVVLRTKTTLTATTLTMSHYNLEFNVQKLDIKDTPYNWYNLDFGKTPMNVWEKSKFMCFDQIYPLKDAIIYVNYSFVKNPKRFLKFGFFDHGFKFEELKTPYKIDLDALPQKFEPLCVTHFTWTEGKYNVMCNGYNILDIRDPNSKLAIEHFSDGKFYYLGNTFKLWKFGDLEIDFAKNTRYINNEVINPNISLMDNKLKNRD